MMITDEQLQEWKALADKATPGEWRSSSDESGELDNTYPGFIETADDGDICQFFTLRERYYGNFEANAAFIAAARTAVPALIAEVERLKAELDAVPVAAITNIWQNNGVVADYHQVRGWLIRFAGGAE